MSRFEREKALDFLKSGLKEMKVKYEIRDLERAVEKLNGTVGWLTHFGFSYATERAPLESFVEKAKGMVKEELEKLYEKSGRYRIILEAVAKGFGDVVRSTNTWRLESAPFQDRISITF